MSAHTVLDSSLVTEKAQTRAERKRLEREKSKSKVTYQYTLEQIRKIKEDAMNEALKEANRQYEESRQAFVNTAIECVICASYITLHDRFGFGQQRLQEYENRMEDILECITTGTITFNELKETRNHLNDKAIYKPKIK